MDGLGKIFSGKKFLENFFWNFCFLKTTNPGSNNV